MSMPVQHSDKAVQTALDEYVRNELTTKEIASIHGISPSTLTVWAENAGIPLRPRGRRKLEAPNARQREILEMCENNTYENVAKHFGMFKQAVQRICKRWANYSKPKKPPFEPGDVILFQGKRVTVLAASIHTGTLVDSRGHKHFQWRWNVGGRLPKKIGVNPKVLNGHSKVAA